MSADIKSLRNRLKSIHSTLHLTSAMGLVASSKIRGVTSKMLKAKDYASALEEMVVLLSANAECKKSPFLSEKKGDRLCLICVAGDRGLAGGYNANIFRFFKTLSPAAVFPIGKRACDRFGKEGKNAEKFSYEDARNLAKTICAGFAAGEYDKAAILYTKYHSMMSQEASLKDLLPIRWEKEGTKTGIIFEPDEKVVLEAMIPDYLAGVIFSCVKESFACEIAARHVAMDNAEKNAKKMIEDLEIQYNRARQSAITQEITEIVAGSGT
jgi:F-type H+-transporting ATPase subunit gamma